MSILTAPNPTPPGLVVPFTKGFTLNPIQVAGTYTLATLAGGDIAITRLIVYVGTAVTGLISVAITDNDSGVSYLSAAEGAVANLLASTTVKTYTTAGVLHSGKLLQYAIVGTGLAGTVGITVTYVPLASSGITLT